MAGVYATGVLVMLVYMTLQRWSVRRLAREAVEVRDPGWTRLLRECAARLGVDRPVRLLRSRERSMPMAFGTRQPVIPIPATADTWPEDRQRAVVLHELAHVARYDCLTQSLAFAACTMYWFHPAAWWVARRLRIERELACDDRAMAALGHKVPAATLVRLRDHGVTPDYVEELKALGYDGLAAGDLVTLRDHGLTAERVRRANARAGTRLPVDMLKSLAAGGMRD